MSIHTTDAIVLRQYPFRETSALVSCMTDRFGKIKGLIKGLREQRGRAPRYHSAMEPLTLSRIVFYDTRASSLHLITQCDLLEAYEPLAQDLDAIRLAATCAELTDIVVGEDEPNPRIFYLLRDTLARLASGDRRLASLRIHFILRLLRLAGFQPRLDECTTCNQSAAGPANGGAAGKRAFWSARQGGLVCERCLHQDPQAEPLAPELLDAFIQSAEADEPHRVILDHTAVIQRHLSEFLQWRLDRPLKTMRAVA